MSIFKCKSCGGTLEINEGSKICTCEYCGLEQTLPSVRDENIQNLFNRATTLRMKSEFDKAAEIYEKILQADEQEAEAYWGLILCKYGIEYVEDPATYKRIPTCHRASYDAVVSDEDYKKALEYADMEQRAIYEEQAKQIDEIQKGILVLAQKADPYDVFICYKETGDNGKRTVDSTIANDIYYQLTQEGYKVFYAAITLEDKLGTEYEPYIFSALNTSKVMLALGTKPEYFEAVWVKNEWSRFLKIMKKDRSKMLIPCYRDMDPYELPEEFGHLQAQDMSKIGFINDLVRGIKKVINKDEDKPKAAETVVVQQAASGTSAVAQIKRGNMALEDHEWDKADSFFEEALNIDPECAEGYLGKLLAQKQCSNIGSLTYYYKNKYSSATTEKLTACDVDMERVNASVSKNFVEDYLSENEISALYPFDRSYISELSCRKSQKDKQLRELAGEKLLQRAKQYAKGDTQKALADMQSTVEKALDDRIKEAQAEDDQNIAAIKAAYALHLDEADAKAAELNVNAQNNREETYQTRVRSMNNAKSILEYSQVMQMFRSMHGYKDTPTLANKCQQEINRIQAEADAEAERQAEAARKAAARKRKIEIIITSVIAAVIVAAIAITLITIYVIIPNNKYNSAVASSQNGDYITAYEEFKNLNGYKDSNEQADNIFVKYELSKLSNAIVGDTVSFGSYNENTEWIVLEKTDDKALIISKECVESKKYNEEYEKVTWENCTLRTWLNDTYFNTAFSEEEQTAVLSTTVSNPDNADYGIDGGNDTVDKVFLLSIDEVNKYFTSNAGRIAYYNGSACWWWLRSPGYDSYYAANVCSDASVLECGINVDSENGLRPTLWVDISNL